MMTGASLREGPLETAARICATTGCKMYGQMSNGRIQRGAGRVAIPKVFYPVDMALEQLKDIDLLVLVGAQIPVGFFAYPGKPGRLVHDGCVVTTLGVMGDDLVGALDALAEETGATTAQPASSPRPRPRRRCRQAISTPTRSAPSSRGSCRNSIICDESVSSGRVFYQQCHNAPQHDYLQLTGGAIGEGIPMCVGAAVACPDRKVIGMQADGSGMYTVQGLWTQARENLDIVTVIFANRTYAILHGEMRAVGVNDFGRNATLMLNLDEPALDWVSMARGMGVEAARATTPRSSPSCSRAHSGARGRS